MCPLRLERSALQRTLLVFGERQGSQEASVLADTGLQEQWVSYFLICGMNWVTSFWCWCAPCCLRGRRCGLGKGTEQKVPVSLSSDRSPGLSREGATSWPTAGWPTQPWPCHLHARAFRPLAPFPWSLLLGQGAGLVPPGGGRASGTDRKDRKGVSQRSLHPRAPGLAALPWGWEREREAEMGEGLSPGAGRLGDRLGRGADGARTQEERGD